MYAGRLDADARQVVKTIEYVCRGSSALILQGDDGLSFPHRLSGFQLWAYATDGSERFRILSFWALA